MATRTMTRPRAVLDTECYRNYWLCKFALVDAPAVRYEFEMYPGRAPLDTAGLVALLASFTIVTFNGNAYDVPMITAALGGYDCAQLKWLSDKIIQDGVRPWELEREYKLVPPAYLDHIDLIEILPGQHGLKMYMAKMHSRRIQDLPIAPDAEIAAEQRPLMRQYCGNDLDGTIDAVRKFAKEIKLRETLGADYGLDLRSKSDAQIAEAVIKSEIGGYIERPTWAIGSWFAYEPPAYIAFQTPMLQQLVTMIAGARFVLGDKGVEMPPELDAAKIKIGNSTYTLGLGGLHSTESGVYHVSDAHTVLQDVDVASYYPRLMLNSGAYPPQMGPAFLVVFERIVNRRLAAKEAGDKTTADSLKITINGTFGKTLSKYGLLVAPKMGVQTTISGQLSILMLIEMLETCGIPVVSANTDGIIIKCPRSHTWLRDQLVKDWEKITGLQTEANDYAAVYSRDVNNYIAVKASDMSVKLKGEYAPPVPVGGSWPNPTGEVCVDAVLAYLLRGVPLADTIRACTDVRKFVYIRNVKGGGQIVYGTEVVAETTKRGMRAQLAAAGWTEFDKEVFWQGVDGSQLPMKEAHKHAVATLRAAAPVPKQYLGKVVRWYYALPACAGHIVYCGTGNKVAKAEGCRPLMELPDAMPADINYEWYVTEAKSLLTDLGVAQI
jgi:hypothetical protein